MGDEDLLQLEQRSQGLSMASHEFSIRSFALEQRDRIATEAAGLLRSAKGKPTGSSRDRVAALLAESDEWAARAVDYAARGTHRAESARIAREPLTYDVRSRPENSWLEDLLKSYRHGDKAATARLDRHASEMRVEMKARAARIGMERRSRGDAIPADAVFERRAGAPEAISHFTPPLWLIDQAVLAARPERVIADLVPSFHLDRGISSINLPRLVTGTLTGASAPRTAVDSRDFTDGVASSPVVPIAGFSDIPLAMIEQLPLNGADLDHVLWKDMLEDYDYQLERMILSGNGTIEAFLGINKIEGINSVTYTSGSPTAIGAYPYLGQAFGLVSDTRKLRPECWVCRGGRWGWWTTSEDEDKRPLGVPDAHNLPPQTPDGVPDPVGGLLGLPVFTSESISTTLGGASPESGTQDQMFALRPRDMYLWESDPVLQAFDQPLSGTMEARLTLRKSAAFIGGRYPSGICTVGGTGFVVPTNE